MFYLLVLVQSLGLTENSDLDGEQAFHRGMFFQYILF